MTTPEPQVKKIWTEAELQALPDNGCNYELIDGELVVSPKNNFEHENICAGLLSAMRVFAKPGGLGAVVGSNLGCWMSNHNCRAPDIAFISKRRLASLGITPSTRKFLPGAPELVVEVVSDSNTRADIDARLKDFFASGARLAWIIHPKQQLVEVCHSPTGREMIHSGGFLDGEDLLPGFCYPVADLFKGWDWE